MVDPDYTATIGLDRDQARALVGLPQHQDP
jgi:hypothetical protein